MATDAWAEIERAVEHGDRDRVIDLCVALEERQRRTMSKRAAALVRRIDLQTEDFRLDDDSRIARAAQAGAASAALFCVGPPPQRRMASRAVMYRLEEVVRSRPREWRDSWALRAVRSHLDELTWSALRALIRDDACTKPDTDDYVRMMVACASRTVPHERWDLGAALLADRGLLDDDVWRIFEIEERVLVPRHFHGPVDWPSALIRLSWDGVISRARLIDECLAALRRDFKQTVAQTFTSFHDQLAPDLEEMTQRRDQYLALLSSPLESTVGFALRHVITLERADALDGRALIEHVRPVLSLRGKGHPRRAMRLLARVITQEPTLIPDVIDPLLDAVMHEDVEVQRVALGMLESHRELLDEERLHQLTRAVAILDPETRTRAVALTGNETGERSEAPVAQVTAVVIPEPPAIDPRLALRLPGRDAIAPIETVDELLDLAAVLLERPEDPDELERFVDGTSRLSGHGVSDERKAALLHRTAAELGPWRRTVSTAKTAVALLIHHWLSIEPTAVTFATARGPRAALGRRLTLLTGPSYQGRRGFVSAPTHRGGWIDPVEFVARLERTNFAHGGDDDLAQALLRLAPDHGEVALEALSRARDNPYLQIYGTEVADVVGAALGAPVRLPLLSLRSTLPASWDAVLAIRAPDSIAVEPQPDEPWTVTRNRSPVAAPPSCPARLLAQFEPGHSRAMDSDMRRWLARVWPANLESYYGVALRRYRMQGVLMLTKRERATLDVALEPMLDSDAPLGPLAIELLATALGSTDANRLMASDVIVETIRTRRLPSTALGTAIGHAILEEGAVPERWASSLSQVPSVSALHAYEAQRTIEAVLASLGEARPRLAGLLELLRTIAQGADARVVNPDARRWLEATKPGGKAAARARAILAVSGTGAHRSLEAAAAASEAEHELALRRRVFMEKASD